MAELKPDSAETRGLLEKVAQGDREALGRLLERYQPRLEAFIGARLDRRVRTRDSVSDVVNVVLLEMTKRMDDFLARKPMPFRSWVCKTAYERVLKVRRHHRRARRAIDREVPLPERSSVLLARPFMSPSASPIDKLVAREVAQRIRRAIAELPEADQEILLMRLVEKQPYADIACVLEIEPEAARKRYGRALLHLRKVLGEHGLLDSHS
jgi:RNA polymerase sigma-70 factor (ECF subfamily)